MSQQHYLPVDWLNPPDNVQAVTTLRVGEAADASADSDYHAFNLADHVGDEPQQVVKNRAKLVADLNLPAEPVWLEQVHGNTVIHLDSATAGRRQADASISREKGMVCAVLTADCLPVFFCNAVGDEVAIAHAGWRGLHAGIISNTVKAMRTPPQDIMVSLGPAIGPESFKVGRDVYDAFVAKDRHNAQAFRQTDDAHYRCDLYQLALNELRTLGVLEIAGGGYDTYKDSEQFFSYRRHKNTGRMASLIWIG